MTRRLGCRGTFNDWQRLEMLSMPSQETLNAFVALVERGEFIAAMERFYAPHATAQENFDPPRVGLQALLENERRSIAGSKQVRARCMEPPLTAGNRVAIRWEFIFENSSGTTTRLEEVVLQTWENEKMVGEQFFYDPRQLRPKTA